MHVGGEVYAFMQASFNDQLKAILWLLNKINYFHACMLNILVAKPPQWFAKGCSQSFLLHLFLHFTLTGLTGGW